MKKVLSIVLVLMMVFAAVACTQTPTPAADNATSEPKTDAPAMTDEPKKEDPAPTEETKTEEPAPTEAPAPVDAPVTTGVKYVPLALNIKNKTGATINEVYLYPVGDENKGNSLVAKGWKDKDADGDNYEKNIYIVRPEGVETELYVVFEDGSSVTYPAGTLAMYDKLSMKGKEPEDLKHEPNDDEGDKKLMDEAVAAGKTADNFYGDYEIIALELKNKTEKDIKEFYFYENGVDPKTYNNMVEYLVDADGNKVDAWKPGKGGLYLFNFFIRPYSNAYEIYVVFDDGTDITYPIDDLFKADSDGHLPNEISLKSNSDPDDIKVKYDGGEDNGELVPDKLNNAIAAGIPVDGWYPTF